MNPVAQAGRFGTSPPSRCAQGQPRVWRKRNPAWRRTVANQIRNLNRLIVLGLWLAPAITHAAVVSADSPDFVLNTTGINLAGGISQADSPDFTLNTSDINLAGGIGQSDSGDFILNTTGINLAGGIGQADSGDFTLNTTGINLAGGIGYGDSGDFTLNTTGTTMPGGVAYADSGDFELNTLVPLYWDGSTNNWADASHWIPNGVPGPHDAAYVTDGWVSVTNDTVVNKLHLFGGIIGGTGTLTVNGLMEWQGGAMQDAGITRIATNAMLNLTNTNSTTYVLGANRTLEIQGSAFWTGTPILTLAQTTYVPGNINMFGGSSIVVRSNASFSFATYNYIIAQGSPAPLFLNEGSVVDAQTQGLHYSAGFGCFFTNAGLVDLSFGEDRVNFAGGFSSGPNSKIRMAVDRYNDYNPALDVSTPTLHSMVVDGHFNLDGDLEYVPFYGTYPLAGDALLVVTNVDHSGTFKRVYGAIDGNGNSVAISYVSNGVLATIGSFSISSPYPIVLLGTTPPPLFAQFGVAPYLFSLPGGTLPPGVNLQANGSFTGLATNLGVYNFTAVVADSTGRKATNNLTMRVQNYTGTSYVWNGGNGAWEAQAQWIPNGIPGSNDEAIVNSGTVNLLFTNEVVSSLIMNGGGLAGGYNMTIGKNMSWSGGTMGGTRLTIAPIAKLNILGSGNHGLGGCILTNNGTVTWVAGLLLGSGCTVYNNGLWDAQGDNVFQNDNAGGSAPVFNNAGIFRKSAGIGATTFNSSTVFNNTGTNDVQSGTVNISGGGSNTATGVFNTTNGATLNFGASYTFNNGSQFTGTGTNLLAAGTFTLNGNITFTKLTQTGGLLAGTQVLNGLFVFNGGSWFSSGGTTIASNSTLTIASQLNWDGRNVTNNGTVRWVGGVLTGGNGTVYNNGLWDAQGDNVFQNDNAGGSAPVFNNAGIFRKSAGIGATTFNSSTVFNNTGTNDVQSGTVNISGGGSNTATGVFNTTNGATLNFGASYTFNNGSQFTGTGTNLLAAGTFTLNGNITFTKLTQTGGLLAGTQVLNGLFVFNGGSWFSSGGTTIASNSTLTIASQLNWDGRNVTNNGTVRWVGGVLTGGNGTVYNNGLWDAQGDNVFQNDNAGGSAPVFNNAGIFRKSAGIGATTFNSSTVFNNTGTNDVQSGTVNISGGGSNTATGVFNTTNGATLNFGASYTFNNGSQFTGTGTNLLAAGTFTLNGNITFTKLTQTGGLLAGTQVLNGLFVFNGGSWFSSGGTTIASNSTLTIASQLNWDGRNVTNNGTVRWVGGVLTGGNGTVYNNGLWDAQGDNVFQNDNAGGSAPVFNNAGIFRKSAGIGATTFNSSTVFNNTGTNDVQSGTVSLSATRNLTGGTINIGISSLTNFGKLSLSGAAGLTGKFSANLNGGYLPTAGSAFPVITYGSLSGSFGSFGLTNSIAWQTNYGSNTFTLTAKSILANVPVQILSPQVVSNLFRFSVQTVSNQNYTLLYNLNLATTNWLPLVYFKGDGLVRLFSFPITNVQSYFKVVTGNVPVPLLLPPPQLSGKTFKFGFQTFSNQNYTVFYNDNLATTNWLPYTNFIGDGSLRQIAVTVTNTQRFFRVSQP